MQEEDLRCGFLGNGYTWWNTKNGETVAHSSPERTVNLYVKLPPEIEERIIHTTATDTSPMSATQEYMKVFSIDPIDPADVKVTRKYETVRENEKLPG